MRLTEREGERAIKKERERVCVYVKEREKSDDMSVWAERQERGKEVCVCVCV